MKKLPVRISCLLLSIAMLFSLLPVSAFAADASEGENVSAPAGASENEDTDSSEDGNTSEDEDIPEDGDTSEDEDTPEGGDSSEGEDTPEGGDSSEDGNTPEDGNSSEDEDPSEDADAPEGEETPEDADIPEDEGASEDEDVATQAAGDLTIPGYSQVTDLRQIKADRDYLIVAQAPDGTFYALYLNADGADKNPGAKGHPECTATLTISGDTVSAVSTADASASIDMDALHVTITNTSGSNYTIKNNTHALRLSSTMYIGASSAPALPLSFTGDGRFAVTGSASSRYLTFNVNGATSAQTHFPDLPTGFCGWNDPQTSTNYYIPIYLFIEGDLPVELGTNLLKMLSGDKIGGGDTADEDPDGQNSWVFTGGRAAQGSFTDVNGARTYAGHFEEYVRYTHAKQLQPSGEPTTPYFQRHVINAAYEGQTLAQIVSSFDDRIGPLKPRAISYLVDDGGSSEEGFKTNLSELIDKALALQGGTGMIVIETLTQTDKDAVDAVVNNLSNEQKPNVLPVLFTNIQKTGGYPNANGHLAMAKQLADAVAGATVSSDANWPYGVSAIPASTMDSGFPNKTSLNHKHGYTNPETLNAGQSAIKTKVEDDSTPMTWLFMGDSITHGAAWTGGYDTLAQLFEKFVKDDLDRTQDIVINAGSSGATVESTVSDLNRRLVKYSPDVVVLMLGTNNANQGTSEDTFKSNLRTILDKIIEKDAVAVLRTPPPTTKSGYDIATYAQCVREVAAEYGDSVILVDHYALWTQNEWEGVFTRDTNLDLHPDEAGHLWFAHQLIKELALWDDSYQICRLEYKEMKETPKIDIPGYTQITDIGQLDPTKGYLIVSQDAQGNLYALYPSVDGETLGAAALPSPGGANDGARAAKLTVNKNKNTVSAVWLKDNSDQNMKKLLFTIKHNTGNKYVFTAFNGRHLNMADYMFTEGEVALTVTIRGTAAPNAFQIKNPDAAGGGRVLDFSTTGDPNAFQGSTYGTDFWCPRSCNMPIYLFVCDDESVKAPTAKEGIQELLAEIGKLTETDYTGASWAALQNAMDGAQAALNSGVSDGDAAVYVAARDALRDAKDGLNKRPEPPTVLPGVKKIADWKTMVPAGGTTQDQPFAIGTAGSQYFRIPAIITLRHQTGANANKNGRLLAAVDARWNHGGDACGLDTLVSYSDDGGSNWRYNFANYFGDGTNTKQTYATAFIDPQLVETKDGDIYLLVDIWPGGIALNTAPYRPVAATGYVKIDGKQRLALYTAALNNTNSAVYDYYVGDFDNGYAPVYEPVDGIDDPFSGYYVDEYYYLYHTSNFSAKNPASDKIYCQRLGSDEWVQQNVFFWNATLHVRNASYLWIVKSTDGGETWGTPQMINDQVRTDGDARFYGVGPGAGLCIDTSDATDPATAIPNGTLLMPTYIWSDEHASFIYSTDGGATWKRGPYATQHTDSNDKTTSESNLIQLDEKTVRQFYRESWNTKSVPVAYTDHTWNSTDGTWTHGEMVTISGANHYGACEISVIKYSKQINGKDVILYSAPSSGAGRYTGVIHAFQVNNDANHTMELLGTYAVTQDGGYYNYSSMTETADGDIALLYEYRNNPDAVTLKLIPFSDIVPTLTLTVSDWEGDYDREPHTIEFQSPDMMTPGFVLQFSIDGESTWHGFDERAHVFTDAGEHTVTVRATLNGLTATGTATVTIHKAMPTLTITTDKTSYAAGDTATFTISGVPSKVTYEGDNEISSIDGAITLRCSNNSTEDGHDPNIELTRQDDGTYTGSHVVKEGNQSFTASFTDGNKNYNDATATRSITVAPPNFGLNAQDVACTYDGKSHSITVTAANGVTLTYCDTEDGDYTLKKPPTYINAGTYTTYFKATKGGETVTGSATVTIARATPTITFQCNHHEGTHGSGEEHSIQTTDLPLVLTIGGVPAEDQGQFTLTTFGDAVRNLKRNSNGTWTASPTLPPITRTYTFTAAFNPTENSNYNRVTAAFTVTVSRPPDEVIDFNFSFVGGVKSDPDVSTRGTLDITYDGVNHSPLEALTYDEGLELSYHVPSSEDTEEGGSADTWTHVLPTFRQPGQHTVSVMASPANSPVVKVLTVVLDIVEKKTPTNLVITPSEENLTGGGELTLTVTGMPAAAGILTVTCDKNVAITEVKRGTYTVTLPDSDASYTFTADYSGAGSYQAAHTTCGVRVTSTKSIEIKLSSLKLEANGTEVALSPAFNPNRLTYSATVGGSSITVTAAGDEGTVTVKKGGKVCDGGVVDLDDGKNTVTVTVTTGPLTTNYTVTITRVADKSALTDAITAANAAKKGVVANNKTADKVAKDTKFVTTAEMKALTDAIAAAQAIAKKADATQAAVDAAAAALKAAVATFEAAIKIGTSEKATSSGSSGSVSSYPTTPGTSSTLPVTTGTSNKNGVLTTETTATPTASTQNGEATSTVSSTVGNEIVEQAAAKNSDNVVIAPEIKGSVSKTEVSIPASTVEQIGKKTDASLTVTTPVASVTIPNGALNDLSKAGGNVKVTAQQAGNTVELSVTAGGKTAGSVPGGMTVTVPVAAPTPGMVAVLVREDGTQKVIRKSTVNGDGVTIPLDGSAKVKIVDNGKRFSDVPATNWAADAVSFVSSHELFNGTSSTTFSPNLPMTRSMLAVVLHNLEDNPAQALTGIFSDVDNTKWYAQGVTWAAEKGIVTGYGGKFDPNGDITREQLAVMLWRYAGSPRAKNGTLNFTDVGKISPWALEAMRWATEKGIINGKGNGILDPTGKATRAQAAQMLKNFMEKQ